MRLDFGGFSRTGTRDTRSIKVDFKQVGGPSPQSVPAVDACGKHCAATALFFCFAAFFLFFVRRFLYCRVFLCPDFFRLLAGVACQRLYKKHVCKGCCMAAVWHKNSVSQAGALNWTRPLRLRISSSWDIRLKDYGWQGSCWWRCWFLLWLAIRDCPVFRLLTGRKWCRSRRQFPTAKKRRNMATPKVNHPFKSPKAIPPIAAKQILPPFLLLILISPFILDYIYDPAVLGFFRGVLAGVAVLISIVVVQDAKDTLKRGRIDTVIYFFVLVLIGGARLHPLIAITAGLFLQQLLRRFSA